MTWRSWEARDWGGAARLANRPARRPADANARARGLADLDHEIDRARRTTDRLAVAYVDIVGLKLENDTHGDAAGDALLQRAVNAIRDHLRSYDMIVRIGGDEFLCVMSGATIQDARERFAELIERADADLPNRRGR
jgi:diguanylate cyclase (GGDEF)-like protein